MTDIPEDRLLPLLYESERLPEILRDEEFWTRLQLLDPADVSDAVRDRFFRALPENEHPRMIELWARQGACVAELIERVGPALARQQLQDNKH